MGLNAPMCLLTSLWNGLGGCSCQGSVSAAGRGSMSPRVAPSMCVAPCSCPPPGLFAVLLHHGPFPYHGSPSSPSCRRKPSLHSPALSSAKGTALQSPALPPSGSALLWRLTRHQTSQPSARGVRGRSGAVGQRNSTSGSCPGVNLCARDGKIVFPFAFKSDSCFFLN